jgi:hypothetical protein
MPPITTNGIISWEQWEEHYKPLNQDMLDYVNDAQDLAGESEESFKHVWTVVDNNPNSVYLDILPGYRVFNRMGYFVTAEKWEDVDMVVSNDKSYY